MNVLELFAGSRSIGKVCDEKGLNVFSSDVNDFDGIDYVCDILEFNPGKVPFVPDIIWASPPCTGFSVAAIGHHWTGGKKGYIPKTDTAKLGIELIKKTLGIINYYLERNKNLCWYIENPRGLMRKMPFMESLPIRHTVTYCQYGDTRMKPTDIWTNNSDWKPKPMCKNGAPCHTPAPRGSKTGTQGLKDNYERSKIPNELCQEVIDSGVELVKFADFCDKMHGITIKHGNA